MNESERKREQFIRSLANQLRVKPFNVEFKVKKKPAGIKIIFEVTQAEMDAITEQVSKHSKSIQKQ